MKSLVIYDSVYGNTLELAKAIGSALAGDASVKQVNEVNPSDVTSVDLLIIGSPTQAGKPTEAMQSFLKRLPDLAGIKVAAFDSRMSMWLARVLGYAAKRIADALKQHGGRLVAPPEGFFVEGRSGRASCRERV